MNSTKPAKRQSLRQPYPWEVYRESAGRLHQPTSLVRRLGHALVVVSVTCAVIGCFVVMGYLALVTSGPVGPMWP